MTLGELEQTEWMADDGKTKRNGIDLTKRLHALRVYTTLHAACQAVKSCSVGNTINTGVSSYTRVK